MAARKRLFHEEDVRRKIKTSQLINRLMAFVNGADDPVSKRPVVMSPHQVNAAIALLRKTLPDLSSAELKLDATQTYIDAIRAASTERHSTDHREVEEKPAELRH